MWRGNMLPAYLRTAMTMKVVRFGDVVKLESERVLQKIPLLLIEAFKDCCAFSQFDDPCHAYPLGERQDFFGSRNPMCDRAPGNLLYWADVAHFADAVMAVIIWLGMREAYTT